jgi:hypothetical protein
MTTTVRSGLTREQVDALKASCGEAFVYSGPIIENPADEPFRVLAGKAADYIREHGWCQFSYEQPTGQVCIIGAITSATTPFDISEELRGYLHDVLGTHGTLWNDLAGRTESEVLGVLDAISEGWL